MDHEKSATRVFVDAKWDMLGAGLDVLVDHKSELDREVQEAEGI
jgi:hypothetical protein